MRHTLLLCLLICCCAASADIYKWVDKDGRVHYSDSPPGDASPSRKIETEPLNTVDSDAVAASPKVVIYSTSWCGPCKVAKAYFKKRGIVFTDYDIEKSRRGKREYDKLGVRSVPVILVDGKKMVGFSPQRFEQLYGE